VSKKREFEHESFQDSEAICTYLETIIAGIRSGELKVSDGNEELALRPRGLMRFEVKATERPDRTRLSLRMSWKPEEEELPGEDPLRITASEG
jgi:amphi-Trp domain-containing protein